MLLYVLCYYILLYVKSHYMLKDVGVL